MSKSDRADNSASRGGQCRIALLALCSLLGFGLVGAASAQPDANPTLAGDCDDTYAAKSDNEYICEQAQAAAMYSQVAAENTKGETWMCVRPADVDITRLDANGFASTRPSDDASPFWLNMANTDRFDRLVENRNFDVILPPWAMRVAPVFSRDGNTIEDQTDLSRSFVRVADAECSSVPATGDPAGVEIMPQS